MAELATRLQFTVVTLDRQVLEVEADEVMLPAFNDYIGVLPGHTPLLTVLKTGAAMYRTGGRAHHFVVTAGFAEVLPDRVTAMVDSATMPQEVDRAAAQRDQAEAERELATLASNDERFEMVQSKLHESTAKLEVSSRAD